MKKVKIFLFGLIFLFILTLSFSQSIIVTSPNGGENWKIGSVHNITWNPGGVPGDIVIKLMKGGSMLGSIAWNIPNSGNYPWTINNIQGKAVQQGKNYRIMIKSLNNPSIKDQSQFPFTISSKGMVLNMDNYIPPGEMISAALKHVFMFKSPKPDDIWYRGGTYTIKWKKLAKMGKNVKITCYLEDSPGRVELVTPSTPNNGSYNWWIPKMHRTGTYIIRLETLDKKHKGDSAPFYIKDKYPSKVKRVRAPAFESPSKASFKINDIKCNNVAPTGIIGKVAVGIVYKSNTSFTFTNPKHAQISLACQILKPLWPMDPVYPNKPLNSGKVTPKMIFTREYGINKLDISPKIINKGSGEFNVSFDCPANIKGLEIIRDKKTSAWSGGSLCRWNYYLKMTVKVHIKTKQGAKIFSKAIYLIYDTKKYPVKVFKLEGEVDECTGGTIYWSGGTI